MPGLTTAFAQGLAANRPAAAASNAGFYYLSTDSAGGTLYQSTGSAWVQVAGSVGGASSVTTKGDLQGYDTAANRVPIGSNGQVLTADSTQALGLKWATPTVAGLTQISKQVLGSSAASVSFASIAATYSALVLEYVAQTDAATTAVTLNMQFNADTGANYDFCSLTPTASVVASGGTIAGTFARAGIVHGSTAPTSTPGAGTIRIPFYAGTTFVKTYTAQDARKDSNALASIYTESYSGFWRNTAAITSILLAPNSGNFIAGSSFVLYGLA